MEKTGRMHYAQAVDYVAQAAAGLRHAHEKGFVHRDVKPSNLMVTRDGKVKILDMGLARSFENVNDNLTAQLGDGGVAGTADFVSPEQALNDQVDARSDVYSLGATLYALVAGRPPFSGNTSQKLIQHQLAEPPRLQRTGATVPQELSDVVAVMMAKDPADRFQSMDEVIDALTPWLPAAPSVTAVGMSMTTKELKAAATSRLAGGSSTRGLRDAAAAALAAAVGPPRNRKPYYIGGGIAAALLLGVGIYFAATPKELAGVVALPHDNTAPASKGPPKKVPGVLARFTWDGAPPTKLALKGVQKLGGDVLPKPWLVSSTKSNMSGGLEVMAEDDGGRTLALWNTSKNTPGVRLDSEDPLYTLKANFKYLLKIDYRTEKGVKSWVEARYSPNPQHLITRTNLPDTDGDWATADLELEPKVEMPLYLSFCNDGKNSERLFLRKVDLLDPRIGSPSAPGGGFLVLPLDAVATASTSEKLFSSNNNQMLDFEEWGPKEFNRVPFHVIDPANGTKNIILLNGSQGQAPPNMPKTVTVPIRSRVVALHVLGGVSGWGWPYSPTADGTTRGAAEGTVTVIARVRYADGAVEDHEWKNGEHFCDYSIGNNAEKMAALTGSTLAFELKGKRQVRYLVVRPFRTDAVVKDIQFVKGPDDDWTAPMIVAVTVEKLAEKK
jgi:hypothetical protein